MTVAEISSMIGTLEIPFAYYQFPEGTAQPCPFICFYLPSNDDFIADNQNYVGISRLIIELYTDEKDFTLESQVESMLRTNEIVYTKTETYIDSERMYMIVYESEVILNA